MAPGDLDFLHPYISDPDRLAAVRASGLLSTAQDPALDRWTRLAAGVLGTPLALLSVVDGDHQFLKSRCGWLGWDGARRLPLSESLCKHVVASGRPLTVPDARQELLLQLHASVAAGDVVAYAGRPVTSPDGHVLGSYCVVDSRPRDWTPRELDLLADLAAGLMTELELRAALERTGGRPPAA